MAEPKTPARPPTANDDDAGFPPIEGKAPAQEGDDDGPDDFESDYHEDGGGD